MYDSKTFIEAVREHMESGASVVSDGRLDVVIALARNAARILPIYEVEADAATGEWLEDPRDTGDTAVSRAFLSAPDTGAYAFERYTAFVSDDDEGEREVERLIRIQWVSDAETAVQAENQDSTEPSTGVKPYLSLGTISG
jgi:hypothetical protein